MAAGLFDGDAIPHGQQQCGAGQFDNHRGQKNESDTATDSADRLGAEQVLHGDRFANAEGLPQEHGQNNPEDDNTESAELDEGKDDGLAHERKVPAGVVDDQARHTRSAGGGEEGIDETQAFAGVGFGEHQEAGAGDDQDDKHAGQDPHGVTAGGGQPDEVTAEFIHNLINQIDAQGRHDQAGRVGGMKEGPGAEDDDQQAQQQRDFDPEGAEKLPLGGGVDESHGFFEKEDPKGDDLDDVELTRRSPCGDLEEAVQQDKGPDHRNARDHIDGGDDPLQRIVFVCDLHGLSIWPWGH